MTVPDDVSEPGTEAPAVAPARGRGVIALLEENCTVCMLCARECPDWCIYIDSHKEEVEPRPGQRERTRNVLDRFAIDYALCLYCGICVDVCPFDALHWAPESTYPAVDLVELTHERDVLRGWLQDVPPPPPLEPAAAPAKELTDAERAAARAVTGGNAGGPPTR